MNRYFLHASLILIFTFVVLALNMATPVAAEAASCITDPIDFVTKKLLPLPSECSVETGYDYATGRTRGKYCGRGGFSTGIYSPAQSCVTPTHIVMHTTKGATSAESNYEYFRNGGGGNGTGSHFVIGTDGEMLQMVEMGRTQVEYAQAVGPMDEHISIEMGSPTGEAGLYTSKQDMITRGSQKQYDNVLALVKRLMETYNIPLERIVSHKSLGGPAGDPGDGWMEDFKNDLPGATALEGGTSGSTTSGGSSVSTSCTITRVGDPTDEAPPLPAVCSTTGGSGGPSSGGSGQANFVYYCQGDPKYQNSCDMANSGCGPTSLAMIMSSFGKTFTPTEIDAQFQATGLRSCGGGSLPDQIFTSGFLERNGFVSGENLILNGKPDLAKIKQYTDQGWLIFVNAYNYPCLGCQEFRTPVGHIFVIDDVDVQGQRMHTRDPNNCSYATGQEVTDRAWVSFSSLYGNTSMNVARPIKPR